MFRNVIRGIFGGQDGRGRSAVRPPQPTHVKGVNKGEELALQKGKEPGRGRRDRPPYRTARDSTAIDPEARNPIHPDSPNIPPV